MLEFLRQIVIFDYLLYILLGILALFFLRIMLVSRRDRGRSIFTLERENANARFSRSLLALLIVIGMMFGLNSLSSTVPEILPTPIATNTPTPIITLPDTPTPPPLLATPTPSATFTPAPLPTPIEVAEETPVPTATANSAGQPANCPNLGSQISRPGNGARISGIIEIFGAAAVDNFQYYKFEFRPVGGEGWNFIARFDNPVQSGALGTWNSDTVAVGNYELRVVVVDQTGNFPEPCVVRLIVE